MQFTSQQVLFQQNKYHFHRGVCCCKPHHILLIMRTDFERSASGQSMLCPLQKGHQYGTMHNIMMMAFLLFGFNHCSKSTDIANITQLQY